MAFLTINSQTIPVLVEGARRDANFVVGVKARTFNGGAISSERLSKRVFVFPTGPMATADVATLRAAIQNGAVVACSGIFFGGAATDCIVDVTDEVFVADGSSDTTYQSLLTLHIEEK